jgi:DNA-directed RNA polymerase specialized sigma subunit
MEPKSVGEKRSYTEEENIALSKQANQKTPEQLAEENRPFVYYLVDKEFSHYYKNVGIPRDVIVSAGMFGLVKAANRSKYGTFLRYASFWIRYHIYVEIRGWFFIKRQASYCSKLNKLRKEQARFLNKFGKEPSYAELAELTGMPEETIYDVIQFDKNNSTSTCSIDAIQEDPDLSAQYERLMESETDEISMDKMEYDDLRKLVEEFLFGEEKTIIIERFFNHKEPIVIARELGFSHSTHVNKVINAAIEHLKHRIKLLDNYGKKTGDNPINCPYVKIARSLRLATATN